MINPTSFKFMIKMQTYIQHTDKIIRHHFDPTFFVRFSSLMVIVCDVLRRKLQKLELRDVWIGKRNDKASC